METIAVYSIKGGVGKTSTAVNLAYYLATRGTRVLLCDLDPQGSASYYFRIIPQNKFSVKDYIRKKSRLNSFISKSNYKNLDVLPSKFSLRKLDIKIRVKGNSTKTLENAFKNFNNDYDYLILDCPPNITLVSENVFNVSDIILEPCIPTTLSLLTHDKLYNFLQSEGYPLNKLVSFFSMYESRKKMHNDILASVQEIPGKFLNTYIPYRADVEKMGLTREPVCVNNPALEIQYRNLWDEIKNYIKELH